MTEPIKFLIVDDAPENLVAMEGLLRRDGRSEEQAESQDVPHGMRSTLRYIS